VAIVPRCFTSGFANSAQYNMPLTGWTNSGAGASGTAPQPGDLVVLVLTDNISGGSVSQIGGSTFTYLAGPTAQLSNGSFQSLVTSRTWTGGETTPQWLYTTGTRIAWVAVALAPDAGQMLVIDTIVTEKVDSTASTSHTAPSAVAMATGTSLVLVVASSSGTGTNAITYTVPASYTLVSSANNIGTSGQYVCGAWVGYRASVSGTVTPGAQTIQGGATTTTATNAVLDHVLVREVPLIATADQAAASEQILSGVPTAPAEQAAAAETMITGIPTGEAGGAVDDIPGVSLVVSVALGTTAAELAGAADGIGVTRGTAPAPTPASAARISAPLFVASQMPRMHLQNLVTGAWLHRDVQGITSPAITWALNTPDTFTCTLGPPRLDLMDASGNPVAQEWRDACYLEESGQIKFGGILTSSTFSGPAWGMTFTGFMGYPAGIPYEGGVYRKTNIDALDVIRDLWAWLQSQPGGNLHLDVDSTKAGVLLGSQVPPGATSTLNGTIRAGVTAFKVHDASGFSAKMIISINNGSPHTIKSVSSNTITITTATGNPHADGQTVAQVVPPTPFELDWWNSTDIGSEIGNIQTEAIFDMRETHAWTDANRSGVRHRLLFGVPRIGTRRTDLRFAEGENIVEAISGSRDGSTFANHVVGLGAGQGKAQVRAEVAQVDGHLRRVFVYSDQTVKTTARMSSKAQKILTSRVGIDSPGSIVVLNHPNAPLGSYFCGDDIYVQWVTGWRSTGIWCRITSISQDPTTSLVTLSLARSDSYTYLAQTGQAGTL
jgi:hypothetical protein